MQKFWISAGYLLAIFLATWSFEYIYKYFGVPGIAASMSFLLLVCLFVTSELDKFSKIAIIFSIISFSLGISNLKYISEDKEKMELVRLIAYNICRGSLMLTFFITMYRVIQRMMKSASKASKTAENN